MLGVCTLYPLPYLEAPIAQLDRAPDFESVGREFESPWAHHDKAGYRVEEREYAEISTLYPTLRRP